MISIRRSFTALALAALLGTGLAPAQDAAEMSADDAAMMEAWMKAATPGDPHARLAAQAGTWRADMEMFMGPDAPPTTTTYRVERSIELDGRVLHEDWSGEWMGQAFHGIGRTGYDNITDRYWSTWTDNMSTAVMVSHGTARPDGSIQMTGSYPDPLTGGAISSRIVWTFPDERTERMEAYETREGREEFLNMRMTLTRTQ